MPNRPQSPCTYCGKPAVSRGRCERHKRGTTTQRGYGPWHKNIRLNWNPLVATGRVKCARCGELINPSEPWDLGHSDNDRSQYNGPEHADCNRRAAAKTQR